MAFCRCKLSFKPRIQLERRRGSMAYNLNMGDSTSSSFVATVDEEPFVTVRRLEEGMIGMIVSERKLRHGRTESQHRLGRIRSLLPRRHARSSEPLNVIDPVLQSRTGIPASSIPPRPGTSTRANTYGWDRPTLLSLLHNVTKHTVLASAAARDRFAWVRTISNGRPSDRIEPGRFLRFSAQSRSPSAALLPTLGS